ncbi:Uma2 family endonuclease [Crossiella sp. NPDC003009]
MVAELVREPFDPLVDFDGMWTTELAEHYLPLPHVPAAKYECLDGKLIMSPCESARNSRAAMRFAILNDSSATAAGLYIHGTVNVTFAIDRWIQPDITVLNQPSEDLVWVPPTLVTLVGELVSPTSRKRDRVEKPELCAAAGIPFYLEIEVRRGLAEAAIHLYRLEGGSYRLAAQALAGQKFETDLPFPMSFDPAELLDRSGS